jgi:hypothetical protein
MPENLRIVIPKSAKGRHSDAEAPSGNRNLEDAELVAPHHLIPADEHLNIHSMLCHKVAQMFPATDSFRLLRIGQCD